MTRWKVVLLILTIAQTANAQGFGGGKCEIGLQRLRPTPLMMVGPIEVSVSLGTNVNRPMVGDASQAIEKGLLAGDPSLNRSAGPPRTQIEVRSDLKTTIQARTRSVPTTRTRTITVYNPQTKQNEMQIVEEVVEVATAYSTVDGNLDISWTARDPVTQRLLLSDQTSAFSAHDDFYPGQGSLRSAEITIINQLSNALSETALKSIAARLIPAPEDVAVVLSKIKSDNGCKLAKAGDWQGAQSFFEGLAPASNQKDEAYRVYNIGVSEEALAYQTGAKGDFQSSVDHLHRAAERLASALGRNAGEKVFVAAQARIEMSLGYYTALLKHKKDNESIAASSPRAPARRE
jgi:hypothetical protein